MFVVFGGILVCADAAGVAGWKDHEGQRRVRWCLLHLTTIFTCTAVHWNCAVLMYGAVDAFEKLRTSLEKECRISEECCSLLLERKFFVLFVKMMEGVADKTITAVVKEAPALLFHLSTISLDNSDIIMVSCGLAVDSLSKHWMLAEGNCVFLSLAASDCSLPLCV